MSNSMDAAQRRRQLRADGLQARSALDEESRKRFSHQITQRIADSPQFRESNTVLIYRAAGCEVDLSELQSCGKRLVYPLCVSQGEMIALLPGGEDAWAPGYCGIMEPIRKRSVLIPPDEIDMVICPCTAFDETCMRMGMGAGFYDRYLPKCSRAILSAAAFTCQKVSAIPAESWDVPMQLIFTEQAVFRPE